MCWCVQILCDMMCGMAGRKLKNKLITGNQSYRSQGVVIIEIIVDKVE